MKLAPLVVAFLLTLFAAGCGGGGGGGGYFGGSGEVSGIVFDQNGDVVRNATVGFDPAHQTVTNSSGVYVLTNLPVDYLDIQATVTVGNANYVGENVALVQNGERTKDVNIAVFPSSQVAAIQGTISDSQGRPLGGAQIFLRPTSPTSIPTSAMSVSDQNGQYYVGSLKAGLAYSVQVNAVGYNSATDAITLNAGETRTINYTVPNAQATTVPTPTNLVANAYTSPATTRSDPRQSLAIEMIKRVLNPRRAAATTQLTPLGNQVEVDLSWNEIVNTALLGYGIYRGPDANHLVNTDFLRDPQAQFYADVDDSLVPQTSYSYAITSLNTLYNGRQGESPMSNIAAVAPLGDLILTAVSLGTPPTVSWQAAPGAANYIVYLYNQYPSIGVADIFDNASSPTTSTSLPFSSTTFTSGQTYYAIVVGENAAKTAFSISPVASFTIP